MDPADLVPLPEALARYPKLAGLHALHQAGWVFKLAEDLDGNFLQLDGFMCWPKNVTDAISVHSETNVQALRTLDDERGIVWTRTGSVDEVVDAVLNLPHPDSPHAPNLVKARGVPQLWIPGR